MLRLLFCLIFISACSMGTIQKGGEDRYYYDSRGEYTKEDLTELAPKVVMTSQRDPRVGKLDELFGPGQKPLKRVGIVIFETMIQPTLGGLSTNDKVFMSDAGKQLMTEKYLSIWEQSLPLIAPELDFVTTSKIKKSKALHAYGQRVPNYINSRRTSLMPDDIFYLEKGKKTSNALVFNPRGMRDLSFLLVPATELMGGPKWSEHNKSFLNDLVKELKLDAAIIIMSKTTWTAAHIEKNSGAIIPEEIEFKISASTLLPLSLYHERLEKLGNKEKTDVTLCYRSYEAQIKVPALISVDPADQNFATIEKEILAPLLKTYADLTQMTLMRVTEDLKKTW